MEQIRAATLPYKVLNSPSQPSQPLVLTLPNAKPLDALTALDQGEADATPAAEAVYWLTHPETPKRQFRFPRSLTSGPANRNGHPTRRPTKNARNDAQ